MFILVALAAGVLVGATQTTTVALLVVTLAGAVGLGLRDRAFYVLDRPTRPAVRLSRWGIWLEAMRISAVSGAAFFCALGPSLPFLGLPEDGALLTLLFSSTRLAGAIFVACLIGLVALPILSVSSFRSDPWKPRDDRFGRSLARTASGALLALALSTTPQAFLVPYLVALFLCATTLILAMRRYRRPRRGPVALPTELAFLADAALSDETRAEIVRRFIGKAVSSRDERLGEWLSTILARPLNPQLEATLFGAIALAPSEVSEPLLAKLLTDPSPMVQSKVAHLAWFGTPKTIEPLRAVTGPSAAVAEAAVARIKSRATTAADAGRLSIADSESGGALSISTTGGLSLAEPARAR